MMTVVVSPAERTPDEPVLDAVVADRDATSVPGAPDPEAPVLDPTAIDANTELTAPEPDEDLYTIDELASLSESAEALRLTAAAPPRPTPSGGDYE